MLLLRLKSQEFLPEMGSLHPGDDLAFQMRFKTFECIAQPNTTLLDCILYLTPLVWVVSL